MLTPARAVLLTGLLLLGTVNAVLASTASADTTPLQFLGFRAGARLTEVEAQLRRLGGSTMRCRRSKIDPRVAECRAALNVPELGVPVDLWVSAIDSTAGVIMLSGVMASDQLESWRQVLQHRYGQVGARVQGTQWMLQWVRRGRMLRLTWRLEKAGKNASVSLVDGRVLDDWARSRSPSPAARSPMVARDSQLVSRTR